MSEKTQNQTALIERLNYLAETSLHLWGIVGESVDCRLINLSENATYLVTDEHGRKTVLRVHRENYHTHNAILSELNWLDALRKSGISTPNPIPGVNGEVIQVGIVNGLPNPRFMELFEFVEGDEPDESGQLISHFKQLGAITAQLHLQVEDWTIPDGFERLVWDVEHIFGPDAHWEDWRNAPNLEPQHLAILEVLESTLAARLERYGQEADRFGLIHADMRLANLLLDKAETNVIDFDDCGFGWFMYDLATALSFIEDHPDAQVMIDAWLKGYQSVRSLHQEDIDEIPSFIMLRRMALLAWIGSHADTDLAIEMAPHFARISYLLALDYLKEKA